jgi:hypothetical protein
MLETIREEEPAAEIERYAESRVTLKKVEEVVDDSYSNNFSPSQTPTIDFKYMISKESQLIKST